MGRRAKIHDDELLERLSRVFRQEGYAGASLASLAQAAGLQKASLYHRFPGGKEQMAREVLDHAAGWLGTHVLEPLRADGDPRKRILGVARKLDEFYSGGRQSCLLNMMSSPHIHEGPFAEPVRQMFDALICALSMPARDAGFDRKQATKRAEHAVALLQGSLVMSRGMGSPRPFKRFLASLPEVLLE